LFVLSFENVSNSQQYPRAFSKGRVTKRVKRFRGQLEFVFNLGGLKRIKARQHFLGRGIDCCY
jgi:hypothetical protein